MRLTFLRNSPWIAVLMFATLAASAGCRRLPYIDQNRVVPHEPLGAVSDEDHEVKQANFTSHKNIRMPAQNLLHQRGAGTWHAADKHR